MITIGFITSRPEPRFDWFFQSLVRQLRPEDEVEIVIVDFYAERRNHDVLAEWHKCGRPGSSFQIAPPKPTVWQGPDRLTKADWWAAANARNTVLCLSSGDYWAQVDDRCVLLDGWMDAVRDAVKGNYAVCGPYQKRTGITVENGAIRHGGIITGEDNRLEYVAKHYDMHDAMTNPYSAPGEWWYGCSTCVPVEWALKVNGYDETCDSSSGEDYIFGLMLQNNGFEIRFDTRMMIVEDRTAECIGPVLHRKDKGTSPNDKSHALLAKLRGLPRAQHPWDLRAIRSGILSGRGNWPRPNWPVVDWYDQQPLRDFTP